jgi:Fe-S-cluster containining protein
MFWILEKIAYDAYLVQQLRSYNTAQKAGVQYCLRCGFCCLRKPCIPTPEEFYKIAEFLKLTPAEALKKYFIIDSLISGGVKFIRPANKSQLDIAGRYLPCGRTYDKGQCIFFQENKCEIYIVRPLQAQMAKCWGKSINPYKAINTWKNFNWSEIGVIKKMLDDSDDWIE